MSSKRRMLLIDSAFPKTLPSDYGYFDDDYSYYDHYPHYRRIGLFGCSVSPGSAQTVSFLGSDSCSGWNPAAHPATILAWERRAR